ncbi:MULTISPECIES: helix-turn-helix domain-containing protein [Amycolatopsis]|uniref:Transcriptional regulator n=1 Tax=Amycolatopsis dongchuanensis TaxID=1070866 RepID=A0ABP9R879_9PSEU|nr:helix-turn-helix transcriptional regulator [Amycolatopsis sacchari]
MLAADNRTDRCEACARSSRLLEPPAPPENFFQQPEVRAALETRHFGRLLRLYRRAHRPAITQVTLAGWLDITQGWLSEIERSARPVTDLANLERWAAILHFPEEHLWFSLPEHRTERYAGPETGSTLPPTAQATGDDVQRRQVLKTAGVGALTAGSALWLGPAAGAAAVASRPDEGSVADIRRATAAFRQADNRYGGGHSRSALDRYLRETVEPRLRSAGNVGSARTELFKAAAELRQLAGWMAYDVGQAGEGRRHLRAALSLAEEAGDDALATEVLAAMSHHAAFRGMVPEAGGVVMQEAAETAVDLALAARSSAKRAGLPALGAEVAVMEAHGLALQGDHRGCLDALHRAEAAFERANPDNTPSWLSYFDGSYLAAKFAHAFQGLGRPQETERYARRSLDMSEGYQRGKLFNTALLAGALADQRRVDEACAAGREAVRMAGSVRSVRAVAYLGDMGRRLAPFSTGEVQALYRELDDIGVPTPRL